MEKLFDSYLALRNEIDQLADRLANQHHEHMQCKKGCDLCCMEFNILPIEFYYIQHKLKTETPEINTEASDESCIFLKNHCCTIYEHRPVICRTHGLPLLYMNSDTEEWELSACELNFTDFDEFDDENTFPQDKFNSRLFVLNEALLKENPNLQHSKFDLLPTRNLV